MAAGVASVSSSQRDEAAIDDQSAINELHGNYLYRTWTTWKGPFKIYLRGAAAALGEVVGAVLGWCRTDA